MDFKHFKHKNVTTNILFVFFLPIMMIIIKINGFKHFKAQTKRF